MSKYELDDLIALLTRYCRTMCSIKHCVGCPIEETFHKLGYE